MTDIDFDELDKAVSSLMDKRNQPSSSSNPEAARGSESTDSVTPEPKPVDEVSFSAPAGDDYQSNQATAATSATVIKRPSGRFMDVVHPSSDMRNAHARPAPSERPAREAAPLRPISDSQPDTNRVATSEDSAEHNSLGDDSSGLPDLSAVSGLFSEEANTADVSGIGLAESGAEAMEPMQSPFLTDVSVDKRPLGRAEDPGGDTGTNVGESDIAVGDGLATDPSVEQSSKPSVDADMPDPIGGWQAPNVENSDNGATDPRASENDPWAAETDSTIAEVPAAEPTPPELSAEVLALESDGAQSGDEVNNSPEPEVEQKPETTTAPVAGDIPTQYTASADDGPEPSAVFEAAADEPKELQHPVKKKSGWMAIVWILLLLIIGAGGGVAVWFFLLK